jgi:hypothetical protein
MIFSQQEILSSALCSRILGIPVAREFKIVYNLQLFFITHDVLWVANEFIYKNPSETASHFYQVNQYLDANICSTLLGNIRLTVEQNI